MEERPSYGLSKLYSTSVKRLWGISRRNSSGTAYLNLVRRRPEFSTARMWRSYELLKHAFELGLISSLEDEVRLYRHHFSLKGYGDVKMVAFNPRSREDRLPSLGYALPDALGPLLGDYNGFSADNPPASAPVSANLRGALCPCRARRPSLVARSVRRELSRATSSVRVCRRRI